MARISVERDVLTPINVFTVSPDDQQRLVELLVEATEAVISHQPGYVSANIQQEPRRRAGDELRAYARLSASR